MQNIDIVITPMGLEHLDDAVRLSHQSNWPHRPEDWQLALDLSEGFVAVTGSGDVVGTILMTPYGKDCATINMVIVDESMRGRGLGRRLMAAAMTLAGDRPLRLIATAEGLPLYERLGFREMGAIVQHQGVAVNIAAPTNTEVATADDLPTILALDRAAYGADRGDLIRRLAEIGEYAVVSREGKAKAFAAIRPFGRGEVIGPVVAPDLDDAKALVSHFISRRNGTFLRVDTGAGTGLAPWLQDHGLVHVGGGIIMARPVITLSVASTVTTFALANQALG
ncbi:GNAT family acetyltransferase [Rhizobium sp. Root149]|uniref:GNAT superfamily N-acetyltransferase n=1 Tax=Rhizobium rhizoryzae TaxID=451876 RepID=A0A7W6LLR0_9HYPH|nr:MULTISPECIES: GNAT family N-acetyltransferase [Rhizobium]KQZ62148.1 GNAT family acetyltransferase [Rhizobium sp. Root149]MBB4145582.1 GNAT superfamily N-acetyltransferase [Rhizobium rhizoryzae]